MSFAIGSSSDALSTIQSLLQSVGNAAGNAAGVGPIGDWLAEAGKGASAAGGAAAGKQPFGAAPPPFKNSTMAALIALKSQDTGHSAQGLFARLDTDGDGKIGQSEFASALSPSGVDAASADSLFGKLDRNGDDGLDVGELISATRRGHGRHHHQVTAGDSGGADSLLNATGADGAKTQTATNADGSSTTTITYADGSTVTMTTPAAKAGGAAQAAPAGPAVNMIEQLIKLQAQLVAKPDASVSALV